MHNTNMLFVPWTLHISRLKMLKHFCIFSGLSALQRYLRDQWKQAVWQRSQCLWTGTWSLEPELPRQQWQVWEERLCCGGRAVAGGCCWAWSSGWRLSGMAMAMRHSWICLEPHPEHLQLEEPRGSGLSLPGTDLAALLWISPCGMANKPPRAPCATSQPRCSTSFSGCWAKVAQGYTLDTFSWSHKRHCEAWNDSKANQTAECSPVFFGAPHPSHVLLQKTQF